MSARNLSRLTALAFLVLGLLSLYVRRSGREEVRTAEEDSRWLLRYDVRFTTLNEQAQVEVAIPDNTPLWEVVSEEFSSKDLRSSFRVGPATGTRQWELVAGHVDSYQATAELELRVLSGDREPNIEALTSNARMRFLRSEEYLPVHSSNVNSALQEAPKGDDTEEEKLQWAFKRCSYPQMRTTSAEEGGDDVQLALETKRATPLGRSRAMVALCRALRIPARLVAGFELRQAEAPQPHVWVEAFRGHQWVPFDPQFGYSRVLPRNFVAVRRGDESLIRAQGLIKPDTLAAKYTIERLDPDDRVLQSGRRRPSQVLDLTRLPVGMHRIMSLMLLLPFGALTTAVFRNVVGIRTFGTFAPALLALSFLYSAWGTGLLILSVVVGAGILGRALLERLHLLMVPRLSIILTTIILCVVFGVSLLDYMGVTPSADAVLLPLVILTIMIERLYVAAEEDGVSFSLQLVAGTVVVSTCCYLLLSWERIGRLILIYPELHLLTIAAFIVIGRYSGYRVTELIRFRDLARTETRTP